MCWMRCNVEPGIRTVKDILTGWLQIQWQCSTRSVIRPSSRHHNLTTPRRQRIRESMPLDFLYQPRDGDTLIAQGDFPSADIEKPAVHRDYMLQMTGAISISPTGQFQLWFAQVWFEHGLIFNAWFYDFVVKEKCQLQPKVWKKRHNCCLQ